MRDCPVERAAVIGRPGFASTVLVPQLLEHGRHAVAWMAVGMPHRAFSACSAFVLDREVFGRNAVDHGQIQSLVTAMGIDLAAARALCLTASRALDAGDAAATRKVLSIIEGTPQLLERLLAVAAVAVHYLDHSDTALIELAGRTAGDARRRFTVTVNPGEAFAELARHATARPAPPGPPADCRLAVATGPPKPCGCPSTPATSARRGAASPGPDGAVRSTPTATLAARRVPCAKPLRPRAWRRPR
ncbi:acyl-CoA dehydrogenase family protein [Streptomyces sp. NPDC054866]